MSTHTPAPWIFNSDSTDKRIFSYIRRRDGVAVCKFYTTNFKYGEAIANAHLISASPEMLDALKFVRTMIVTSPSVREYWGDVVERIDLAINLAEGKIK